MKNSFCLALALSGALIGCSTAEHPPVIASHADIPVQLPIQFTTYRNFYTFMAQREGISMDANSLFKFAADSETEIYSFDNPPAYLWIVTPHFYNGGIYDEIRGAQGNGGYYLLRPLAHNFTSLNTDCGFELVGVAEGNAFRWSSMNNKTRFTTYWHISATEHPETTYEWNGKFFEQVK